MFAVFRRVPKSNKIFNLLVIRRIAPDWIVGTAKHGAKIDEIHRRPRGPASVVRTTVFPRSFCFKRPKKVVKTTVDNGNMGRR